MRHPAKRQHPHLGNAARGDSPDIDVEAARERLREAQAALAGLGYQVSGHEDPAHGFDGIWGPQTRQAVAQFQSENDLAGHGELNEATWQAIVEAHAEAYTETAIGDAPMQDVELAMHEVLHADDHDSVTEQLGELLDDAPEDLDFNAEAASKI